jgi:hypothetical protein
MPDFDQILPHEYKSFFFTKTLRNPNHRNAIKSCFPDKSATQRPSTGQNTGCLKGFVVILSYRGSMEHLLTIGCR